MIWLIIIGSIKYSRYGLKKVNNLEIDPKVETVVKSQVMLVMPGMTKKILKYHIFSSKKSIFPMSNRIYRAILFWNKHITTLAPCAHSCLTQCFQHSPFSFYRRIYFRYYDHYDAVMPFGSGMSSWQSEL